MAASYYFYMSWNAKLVVLIGTTTLVSWGAAILMEKCGTNKAKKKKWLAAAAVVSLGILFFFKYFDFFSTSLNRLAGRFTPVADPFVLSLMLPVGISFYTFQTLGYVIDVYRGDVKAEKHLGIYALFVSFFPQLVAGPIERAKNLLPQFRQKHSPNAESMAWGLRYICLGLLKKAVIADTLALVVNAVYGELTLYSPMSQLLATLLFAVQIFCDFSGYTDIARGSAAILGFSLMENFKAPYLAKSMQEFWKRWHISLSTWFMDYVYIPLGGSRAGRAKHLRNLFITFMLSGLWHGASWNFFLWGCYNGALVAFDVLVKPLRQKISGAAKSKPARIVFNTVQTVITFCFVCGGWIIFRAENLHDIARVVTGIPGAMAHPISNLAESFVSLFGAYTFQLKIVTAGIILLVIIDALINRGKEPAALLAKQKAPLRAVVTYIVALITIAGMLMLPEHMNVEFIYFQF